MFSYVLSTVVRAPRWVVVALALLVVASSAMVADRRQATTKPKSAAASTSAEKSPEPSATPSARRSEQASRSAKRKPASMSVKRKPAAASAKHKPASRAGDRRVRHAKPLKRVAPAVRKQVPRLPVASSAAETVASAKTSTSNDPGYCLSWSRQQADIPSRYGDAATAWRHATGRHFGDPNPPKGAAVYWTGGSSGYGHIAISLGNGLVRSSDAGGAGVVATVPLRQLTREWNLTYVGWSDSINGYRIAGVAKA